MACQRCDVQYDDDSCDCVPLDRLETMRYETPRRAVELLVPECRRLNAELAAAEGALLAVLKATRTLRVDEMVSGSALIAVASDFCDHRR